MRSLNKHRRHSVGFSCYSSPECNRISSGMLLQGMVFSTWLMLDSGFLGIQFSQYNNTNPGMLVLSLATLWCFIPPGSRSCLALEGTQAFLLAGVLVQDSSGWSDTSCFFRTNSAFTWLPPLACPTTARGKWLQDWKQVMGVKSVGSLRWGEGSLLAEPITFSSPSWAQAKAGFLALPLVGCGCYEDCQTGSPEDLTRIQQCLVLFLFSSLFFCSPPPQPPDLKHFVVVVIHSYSAVFRTATVIYLGIDETQSSKDTPSTRDGTCQQLCCEVPVNIHEKSKQSVGSSQEQLWRSGGRCLFLWSCLQTGAISCHRVVECDLSFSSVIDSPCLQTS